MKFEKELRLDIPSQYTIRLHGEELDHFEDMMRRALNTWEDTPQFLNELYYTILAANALRHQGQKDQKD